MPDPASGMEMEPEFVRLVDEIERSSSFGDYNAADAARGLLWRWHVAAVERAVREAFREGFHTGSDPAWCEKQLRRAGVKAEAHEEAAEEYFWNASDVKASVTDATA